MKLILTYNLKYDFAVNTEKYFLFKKKKKKSNLIIQLSFIQRQ